MAKRGGQREIERQQKELRQAVILAAEITVGVRDHTIEGGECVFRHETQI